jgi:hypothetical protein
MEHGAWCLLPAILNTKRKTKNGDYSGSYAKFAAKSKIKKDYFLLLRSQNYCSVRKDFCKYFFSNELLFIISCLKVISLRQYRKL